MRAFSYEKPASPADAAARAAQVEGATFLAGGTNLLDLMKLEIEAPAHVIDVNGLGLDEGTETYCNAPVARISTTPTCPVTNARPDRAAPP